MFLKKKIKPTVGHREKTAFIRMWGSLFRSPARVSIISFAIVIFLGTLLLMLPEASTKGSIHFVNALFTATSATCVTGLSVLDTGSSLTLFGQIVILVLIQVGGLGIMTISTIFIMALGRRPSMTGHIVIHDTLTHGGEKSLSGLLKNVLLFTIVIEGIGAAILFFQFLPGRSIAAAAYVSIFHSVSAFCNAGFSLFPDSLVGFGDNLVLNLTICFLIVTGGLGFLVLSELKRKLPYNRRALSRLSLHSRLVLSTTGLLILFGSILVILMEWQNTLAPLPLSQKILSGFFQAVTSRTAGFNTLPIEQLANETLFFLILMMLIGASPGSCGGGIKTTTFSCLALLGISRFFGHNRPRIYQRTIPQESIAKSTSIVMISFTVIVAATLFLLMTELGEVSHQFSRGKFLEILFEVVSAFGTVGLSTGITGSLSTVGKCIIVLVMFIGRLGPLLVALAISRSEPSRYYFAEENIMVG